MWDLSNVKLSNAICLKIFSITFFLKTRDIVIIKLISHTLPRCFGVVMVTWLSMFEEYKGRKKGGGGETMEVFKTDWLFFLGLVHCSASFVTFTHWTTRPRLNSHLSKERQQIPYFANTLLVQVFVTNTFKCSWRCRCFHLPKSKCLLLFLIFFSCILILNEKWFDMMHDITDCY